ncbi:MAG: hypothetical protein ACTHMR_10120 [Thermomicrobiales bacterium]
MAALDDAAREIHILREENARLYKALGVVAEVARRALAGDNEIPRGASGRDKAFRRLEEFCGSMIFLERYATEQAREQAEDVSNAIEIGSRAR